MHPGGAEKNSKIVDSQDYASNKPAVAMMRLHAWLFGSTSSVSSFAARSC
jgi:hypothetical protein